ncbi:unnamed protein product (macronuclear) [Paramecium tetraurelia]|uniref:RanBP2-type domain-containing protein n=1 Tax=Paramecium tetraurelia TaxID=5888 RepID=A0D429_PARTE|nr:uncharacterized protein GSPATT00013261001 [Paramecium tetraurelia]CAK77796.1 unnamed protein product [Paramecium tetraurelia]|eukprot:XP_001445193.1 hypothetical protein (macronuclear) [Paramecium tetraurelia strain d4-2]
MQNKPLDWICIGCKNLNYSFRKYCNRCQTFTRDAPGTKFIPLEQPNIIDSLKLSEPDLTGSGHSTTDSVGSKTQDYTVFHQALFLENLTQSQQETVNKNFNFMKICTICRTENYFYQSKCKECGFRITMV